MKRTGGFQPIPGGPSSNREPSIPHEGIPISTTGKQRCHVHLECQPLRALEFENARLIAEVAAWQYRFPDHSYDLDSDSVVGD